MFFEEEHEHEQCSICLDEMETTEEFSHQLEKISLLKCNHRFHARCFKKYMNFEKKNGRKKILCPLCRKVILNLTDDHETMNRYNPERNIDDDYDSFPDEDDDENNEERITTVENINIIMIYNLFDILFCCSFFER